MEFNQIASPRSGVIQNIERISGLGLGTISDNAAPDYYLDNFLGLTNQWLDKVEQFIREANDEWIFDDTNNTGDIPEEYDFVNDAQIATLDADIVKIRRVEARDAGTTATFTAAVTDVITSAAHGMSNGKKVVLTTTGTLPTGLSTSTRYYVIEATTNTFELSVDPGGTAVDITGTGSGVHTWSTEEDWYNLDYYQEKDRIENLYGQDSGKPSKYFFQGRDFITDVPVDTAKADKYRITYDRTAHAFVIGDTTAEPGFASQFHWIIVYGAVMDWAEGKYPDIYQKCYLKIFGQNENDENSLKRMLQSHYSTQNRDSKYEVGRETINFG